MVSCLWYFSVIIQDQSILEVHTQMKLLEEEQEYNINHVRESFLQEITQLNDIIQVTTWDLCLIIYTVDNDLQDIKLIQRNIIELMTN